MSLGNNLKRLRKYKGLSQDQLSKITGIRVAHVSKLENNASDPKLSTIYKLMDGLECSAESLLMDKDKVGLNSILKSLLERVEQLPDEDKKTVIRLMHYYSQGVGEELALTKNRHWFKNFVRGETAENPLPEEKAVE